MERTTYSIVRRGFHLLPFLLWSLVTAAAARGVPESKPARVVVEDSLAVFGLTGVIFVVVGSLLVYAVVKFRVTAENAVSGRPR